MVTVYKVVSGSIAENAGIRAGDILHTVNGKEISDVLDYRFYLTEKKAELSLTRDGVFYNVKIHKEMYADIGLEFRTYLMDEKHSCRNRCIFCFIDQLPKGMRETLYFKDDDSRLSFLMGNYITLTNLKEADVDRIIKMRISPINVSVHTMNPELRVTMMKNKNAGIVLGYLKKLSDAGIYLNCQIVLCKGINDGDELIYSMKELSKFYPQVSSVSIVPAGMTKYRNGLYPLSPYTEEECEKIIDQVTGYGDQCLKKYGSRIFYCGDEFYVKSGRPIPDEKFYEDFAQIENGVGMMASMKAEFDSELSQIETKKVAPRKVSCATGYAAYNFIKSLADEVSKVRQGLQVNVYKIKNNFFGESITVSGLLTGTDLAEQLKPHAEKGELGDTLYLSRNMLRAEGDFFLDGMTPDELSEKLSGIKIKFLQNDGAKFFLAISEKK